MDERAYMVMAVDENGDAHLFASDDRHRAEEVWSKMREKYSDVSANWLANDNDANSGD